MSLFSTKIKIVSGYILSVIFIIAMIIYIGNKLLILTETDKQDTRLHKQKSIANNIVNKLNIIEIAGLSLYIGEHNEYVKYKKNMRDIANAVDSLRIITIDSMQLIRLDSISMLLNSKEKNMRALLQAMKSSNSDSIYRLNIKNIIEEYDSTEYSPQTIHKIITHTQVRSEEQQPRNFFKRLGRLFSSSKNDTTIIKDTIREEYIDSSAWRNTSSDTIIAILSNIQERATEAKKQQSIVLSKSIYNMQKNSLELNTKVQGILKRFEQEEENKLQQQIEEKNHIRRSSAYTLGSIAIVAIIIIVIFIIVILKDITRSNKYRADLEKSKERADNLLKAREQLMLTITHDIKAPTASILGYTELLQEITHDERQYIYLNNIHSSARHLIKLVTSLLDFYRLDADKIEIESITFNPKELFDTIAISYIPMIENKGLEFRYNCNNNLDDIFIGDPLHIRQIAENILSNALKFTNEGYIELKTDIQEDIMHIRIEDSGCGIPTEEKEHIFKEFTRLRNAQGAEGFGLGLAISQKLISLMNGDINFSSEEGVGTIFEVHIPLKKSEKENPTTEEETTLPPINILIIDDDRLQLQLTSAMLERPGMNVTCCEKPQEFIESLKNNSYDIILTDIQMPEANGFEILKQIRGLQRHAQEVPVLAVTARNDITDEEAQKSGFCGCLHKPFTQKELIKSITRNCSKGRSFDFSSLTAFSLDDNDAAIEILRTFINETNSMQKGLEEALESNDMKTATNITHRLLPIFKMLNTQNGIAELEWFEERRNEKEFSSEAAKKIIFIKNELTIIISEAEKNISKF